MGRPPVLESIRIKAKKDIKRNIASQERVNEEVVRMLIVWFTAQGIMFKKILGRKNWFTFNIYPHEVYPCTGTEALYKSYGPYGE